MSTAGPDLDLSRLDVHVATLIEDIRQRTRALQPAAEPAEVSWEALADLDDEALIRAAYRYLTGHPIEPERLDHYLSRLRGGEDRYDLLAAIQVSPEGQRHAAPAPGLRRALLKRKVRRVPVLGRLLALMLEIVGLPARQQRDNARYYRWQNQLALQAILLQQQSNLLEWHQHRWQILQDQAPEARLGELEQTLPDLQAELAEQRQIAQDLRRRLSLLETAAPAVPVAGESQVANLPAGLLLALDERFALDAQAAQGLHGHYLPLLKECRALREGLPLVELECGAGEWLASLPAAFKVQGVESLAAPAALAAERGLAVVCQDSLAWLQQQADGSLGALCSRLLADRLEPARLSLLLDEAQRVLAPGGLLLLQAMDPGATDGASAFWIDPRHGRPLPPALLAFLYEYKGFTRVVVETPPACHAAADPAAPHWQPYAVIGYRAAL
ncbi:hypothetical protein [Pseudomonas rhizoryzae]|uniref:hypothetical protein n=1 Tax=Pseudomonas rhizoryzae TaxID=2571129 RepID=UPI000736FED5|nr:hypothetical protein [Pseudomonas rhizoryzae]